jgi:hypothetical protein
MSEFTEVAILVALFIAAIFVSLTIAKIANELGAQIVTGVARGAPLSRGTREAMLFQMWLPHQAGQMACQIFYVIAFLTLANHTSGEDIKLVAHVLAFIAAVFSVFALMTATFGLFQYRSFLRRTR